MEKEVWFGFTSLRRKANAFSWASVEAARCHFLELLLVPNIATESIRIQDTEGPHCSRGCSRKYIKSMWVRQGQITHSTNSHGAAASCPACTTEPCTAEGPWNTGGFFGGLGGGNLLHIQANIYSVLIRCQVCYKDNKQVLDKIFVPL